MACKVEGLKAGEDDAEIARLRALATAQQSVLSDSNPLGGPASRIRSKLKIPPFDTMITPWESKFGTQPNWHFVAHALVPGVSDTICGWLTAQLKEEYGRKYVYLSEISTRRIKDEIYGGVGKMLHDALVAAARANGYDFIYLYPVSKAISKIYERWGYTPSSDVLLHQFYVINLLRGPTDAMKSVLTPPRQAVDIMRRARDVFGPKFDEYRRGVLADPDNVKEVELLLNEFDEENAAGELIERDRRTGPLAEIAAAEEARHEGQRQQMRKRLEPMKNPKGGRRKTKKSKRRSRKTRRRHK